MAEVEKIVEQLVNPIVQQENLELVEVEYVKEGSAYYLRVFLDKEGGIDLEEIAKASELLSEKLDSLNPDPFPNPYILEVSSPGIERPIKSEKEFEDSVGTYINVTLYQALDKKKMYEGTLKQYNNEELVLEIKIKTRRKEITIPTKLIAKARHAIEF